MRILIVGHAYPPYPGGLAHVLYNVATRLTMMGHEVTVLTLKWTGGVQDIVNDRLRVIRVPGIVPSNSYFAPTPNFINKLIGLIREFRPDVIHVHNAGSLISPVSLAIARSLSNGNYKIVFTPHYHESGSRADTKTLWVIYKPVIQKVLRLVDKIHAVSVFEAHLLRRDYGVDPVVIPNGVSEDVYEIRSQKVPYVAAYAGRIEGYKRVNLAVKAIAKAQEITGRKITFKVIGNGSALSDVLKLSKSLGVEVKYMDFLPRRRYIEELGSSSAFINLSTYEAYSIVTAEALALGLPAVVAKPWGLIFKPFGAITVNPINIDETATAIVKALDLGLERGSVKVPTWTEVAYEYVRKLYS